MAKDTGNTQQDSQNGSGNPLPEVPFARIENAVKSIRYGIVQLIIQDGRVIQIDKTEKIRLV